MVRELGRGGLGVVYEAIEKPLGRTVALKLLYPEHAVHPARSASFLEEARRIARLQHPSIIGIHRVGQCEGMYFLALEFIDGHCLDAILARTALPVAKSVEIIKTVAGALDYTHARSIVHRHLKPGNILIRRDGRAVLGDFGISADLAATASDGSQAAPISTPAYMSPEQALGTPVGAPSDVYSLGVVAFELLVGRVPFSADFAFELLRMHVRDPAPRVSTLVGAVPEQLGILVDRMLEKDPAKRPACAEIASALEKLAAGGDEATVSRKPCSACSPPESSPRSYLEESDVTVVSYRVRDFTRELCHELLPARVAFVLESWYRLAQHAVTANGGVIDRHVADSITALFGYPDRHADHARRALQATRDLLRAIALFNQAHDLELEPLAAIACGTALVGHVEGDSASTSIQGPLLGEMRVLSMRDDLRAPARLNRAAYRRTSTLAEFARVEDPALGEIWTSSL